MNRHDSRMAAVQGMYSWDMCADKEAADVTAFNWLEKKGSDEDMLFARLLLSGTLENINGIDSLIKSHLSPKWDFDRINRVSLALLRISVYSLLYQKDIDISIIIDEAIEIARSFSIDDQTSFINGILDKIGKENR